MRDKIIIFNKISFVTANREFDRTQIWKNSKNVQEGKMKLNVCNMESCNLPANMRVRKMLLKCIYGDVLLVKNKCIINRCI